MARSLDYSLSSANVFAAFLFALIPTVFVRANLKHVIEVIINKDVENRAQCYIIPNNAVLGVITFYSFQHLGASTKLSTRDNL